MWILESQGKKCVLTEAGDQEHRRYLKGERWASTVLGADPGVQSSLEDIKLL